VRSPRSSKAAISTIFLSLSPCGGTSITNSVFDQEIADYQGERREEKVKGDPVLSITFTHHPV
jgi:hypothetical protein